MKLFNTISLLFPMPDNRAKHDDDNEETNDSNNHQGCDMQIVSALAHPRRHCACSALLAVKFICRLLSIG